MPRKHAVPSKNTYDPPAADGSVVMRVDATHDAIIDASLVEQFRKRHWAIHRNNGKEYLRASNDGMYAHHFVAGKPVRGTRLVVHINGNLLDCRLSNLKHVDPYEVQCRAKRAINSNTGVENVTREYGRFVIRHRVNGRKRVYVDSLADAKNWLETHASAHNK